MDDCCVRRRRCSCRHRPGRCCPLNSSPCRHQPHPVTSRCVKPISPLILSWIIPTLQVPFVTYLAV